MFISKILSAAPVLAQAEEFSEVAMNVTKISNPYDASFKAVQMIIGACAPPQVKYPLKCLALVSQLSVVIASGGTTSILSAALSIGSTRQVLEELL